MVICLERGADLRMAQLMPLLLTVSCFSKIQIGFTFLVLAHPGSPGKRAVKRVCVCVCVCVWARRCTVSYNNRWCFVCVFTVVYSRAVSAGRWVSCRGRFLQAERLPAEAGLGWSASATAESMSSVLFSLWPVDQRPVHDLRWTQQQRRILSYSQENIRRQNQPSHLLLATRYVWDEQHL